MNTATLAPTNSTHTTTGPALHSGEYLTPVQAADALGLQPSTLERWRSVDPGRLPFHKVGRRVFYHRRDIDAFMLASRHGDTTSGEGGGNHG